METSHEISVYGAGELPRTIDALGDAVSAAIEGFGEVIKSELGRKGWKLTLGFESPNVFSALLDGVAQVLLDHDLPSTRSRSRCMADPNVLWISSDRGFIVERRLGIEGRIGRASPRPAREYTVLTISLNRRGYLLTA